MKKTRRTIQTDQYWIIEFKDGSVGLIPPPEQFVKLVGMYTFGEITKRTMDNLIDDWQLRIASLLLKDGVLEIRGKYLGLAPGY